MPFYDVLCNSCGLDFADFQPRRKLFSVYDKAPLFGLHRQTINHGINGYNQYSKISTSVERQNEFHFG
jgi:hypothetical protein